MDFYIYSQSFFLSLRRAGIVQDYSQYIWSSGRFYYSGDSSGIGDTRFVEELFGCQSNLTDFLSLMSGKDLPIIETRFGEILGEEKFLKDAVERFDRRKNDYGEETKRIED